MIHVMLTSKNLKKVINDVKTVLNKRDDMALYDSDRDMLNQICEFMIVDTAVNKHGYDENINEHITIAKSILEDSENIGTPNELDYVIMTMKLFMTAGVTYSKSYNMVELIKLLGVYAKVVMTNITDKDYIMCLDSNKFKFYLNKFNGVNPDNINMTKEMLELVSSNTISYSKFNSSHPRIKEQMFMDMAKILTESGRKYELYKGNDKAQRFIDDIIAKIGYSMAVIMLFNKYIPPSIIIYPDQSALLLTFKGILMATLNSHMASTNTVNEYLVSLTAIVSMLYSECTIETKIIYKLSDDVKEYIVVSAKEVLQNLEYMEVPYELISKRFNDESEDVYVRVAAIIELFRRLMRDIFENVITHINT